ncbi:MAG: T9SS type A sorting domain-containing protein [Candidatus Marinimicrobia bacterium]|nr:T9SS type A sorting domain-containing protein [Candidatus Neomarinimicrobiota bacterium]MBL7046328.1 T9SS type A sorting domain-containing protein [Candidatus Neomarinimicrobiota bacterium]
MTKKLTGILLLTNILYAFTFYINLDGTGDFTTIQEGIDAATHGDTVLVYPGIYYENINYNGKNIIVTSLYLLTPVDSLIRQTIIDGNYNGSVVKFVSGESRNSVLNGFTIKHGYGIGNSGSGIYIRMSNPTLMNCIIEKNTALYGGGIASSQYSNPMLQKVTIRYNHAFRYGGGIVVYQYSNVTFDSSQLCNVYLNTAGWGSDISKGSSPSEELYVLVDTFTVIDPDNYFIYSMETYSFSAQNSKITPINDDLYVSAVGDDNNSGLTKDEPLQTIAYALTKISSDSLHPNTIHIADGIYSSSLNDQRFPLNCRSYVSLMGESEENTILDGDSLSMILFAYDKETDYAIKNLSLRNACQSSSIGCAEFVGNVNLLLENITFQNNYGWGRSALCCRDSCSVFLRNITAINNRGGKAIGLGGSSFMSVENCLIKGNVPGNGVNTGDGGGIVLDQYYAVLRNVEITENINNMTDWFGSSVAIAAVTQTTIDLINVTIGNNITPTGGAITCAQGVTMNITNSILYGDSPREIFLNGTVLPNTITIKNSLVQGGQSAIYNYGGNNTINWLDENLDTIPYFTGDGEYPYALSDSSLCIDAGVKDTIGLNLPEYDLAGYPRIVGGRIDMGAYEWQGTTSIRESNTDINPESYLLRNFPNPFNSKTTISFQLPIASQTNLTIYNINGQLVKTLMNAYASIGNYQLIWNGKNNSGQSVPSGMYLIKLSANRNVTRAKILLLK